MTRAQRDTLAWQVTAMFYLAVNCIRTTRLKVVKKLQVPPCVGIFCLVWAQCKVYFFVCVVFAGWSICWRAIICTDCWEWQTQTDSLTLPQRCTRTTECNQSQTLAFRKDNRQLVLPVAIELLYSLHAFDWHNSFQRHFLNCLKLSLRTAFGLLVHLWMKLLVVFLRTALSFLNIFEPTIYANHRQFILCMSVHPCS